MGDYQRFFSYQFHINYLNQNVMVSVLLEACTVLSPLDVSREIQVNIVNKKCC